MGLARLATAAIGGNKRTVRFPLKVSQRTGYFLGFLGGIATTVGVSSRRGRDL
jgi:hypothetical protein